MDRQIKRQFQPQMTTIALAASAWPSMYNRSGQITRQVQFSDFEPQTDTFLEDVLQGLQKMPKDLPSKYLYDSVGSDLFEQICLLSEYYPTRTELTIMQEHLDEIVALLGEHCLLIEYGSGNSTKTRKLLDALQQPAGYVPIDISKEYLLQAATSLAIAYPELEVLPICADYTTIFEIPSPQAPVSQRVCYYPGSTIGNFDPEPAKIFLQQIAQVCKGGGLLIGVDLKKDFNILHRAYNDQQDVTARFNLNLLERINKELGANFQLEYFQHYAFYNPWQSRIEMHLESLKDQSVHIGDHEIIFRQGESVWTESSYKYTLDEFAQLAASAGFAVKRVWTDAQGLFSIQYLVAQD